MSYTVGRGTESPFELVGAPWIDGKALADQLNARGIPGVRIESATFTPSQWVYPGQSCGGIRITLTDSGYSCGTRGLRCCARLRRRFRRSEPHFERCTDATCKRAIPILLEYAARYVAPQSAHSVRGRRSVVQVFGSRRLMDCNT